MGGISTVAWNLPFLIADGLDVIDSTKLPDEAAAQQKLYSDVEQTMDSKRRTRAMAAIATALAGTAIGFKLKGTLGALAGAGIGSAAGYEGARQIQKYAFLPLIPLAVVGGGATAAASTPVITSAALALLAYYGPEIAEKGMEQLKSSLSAGLESAMGARQNLQSTGIRSRNLAMNKLEREALKASGGIAAGGLGGYLAGKGISKLTGGGKSMLPTLGALTGIGVAGYLGKDKLMDYVKNM